MEVDVRPAQADVLAAVQSVRRHDGLVRMDLDFPERWDPSPSVVGAASVAVVGMSSVSARTCFAGLDGTDGHARVDTNVLISHLALLRAFVRSADKLPTSNRPLLFVPQVVLSELDGLKASQRAAYSTDSDCAPSRTNISVLARSAIGWLLQTISSGSAVLRGQKRTETLLLPRPNGSRIAEDNDLLVLDAAMWCRDQGLAQNVCLLTDDRNLQLRATVEGLHAHGVAGLRDAASLVSLLSLPPSEFASAAAAASQKVSHRVSRYAPPQSRSNDTPSPRRRQRDEPSAISWQARSVNAEARCLPLDNPVRATDPAGPDLVSGGAQPMNAENGERMIDRPPSEAAPPPPFFIDLPPPPLVSVETPTDVFYNIALLVSHFLALPIYQHVHQHLERTNPSQRKEWLAELGDWQRWLPEDCVTRARKYWEEGDIRGLCRVGLEHAYTTPTASKGRALPAAPTPVAPSSLRKGHSKWSMPPSASSSVGTQRPVTPPPGPPLSSSRRQPAPQLAHVYRDLPVVRDFLGARPDSILSWSAPRWEVIIETTGLLLVAVLGGTFKADVRREVDEIVRVWVADLRICGISVDVQL